MMARVVMYKIVVKTRMLAGTFANDASLGSIMSCSIAREYFPVVFALLRQVDSERASPVLIYMASVYKGPLSRVSIAASPPLGR